MGPGPFELVSSFARAASVWRPDAPAVFIQVLGGRTAHALRIAVARERWRGRQFAWLLSTRLLSLNRDRSVPGEMVQRGSAHRRATRRGRRTEFG